MIGAMDPNHCQDCADDLAGMRCESGWTGDRCTFPLGHDGDHSNENGLANAAIPGFIFDPATGDYVPEGEARALDGNR